MLSNLNSFVLRSYRSYEAGCFAHTGIDTWFAKQGLFRPNSIHEIGL